MSAPPPSRTEPSASVRSPLIRSLRAGALAGPLLPSLLGLVLAALLPPAAAAAPAQADGPADATDRPNFVFILVDDLGYMDVEAYNPGSFYETPNIDRLAEQGMRFTDGYMANPVCSPSRYSIMTGRYPSRPNLTNWFSGTRVERFRGAEFGDRMPLSETTIAEALGEAGYRTAFLGKWHLGPDSTHWPRRQGFDVNVGGFSAGSPVADGGEGYFSPYGNPRLEDGPAGEYLTERLGREATNLIDRFRDQPFLIYLSFYSVHIPLRAPESRIAPYRDRSVDLPDDLVFGQLDQVWPTDEPRRERLVQNHPTYAAMVESVDRQVGRILRRLEELDLGDETVIVFTSDHGGLSTAEGLPTSNRPLRAGKGWLNEGGLRVPWLIKWPGVTEPGSVTDEPVVSTDFYPTLLELAGLPLRPSQHEDGVSLAPLLRDGGAELDREALYWHYPHYSNQGGLPGGAVRMGRYKLIEEYEEGRTFLYDLETDVGERHDLSDARPERVETMRERLHLWYEEVGARFLRPRDEGGAEPWRP